MLKHINILSYKENLLFPLFEKYRDLVRNNSELVFPVVLVLLRKLHVIHFIVFLYEKVLVSVLKNSISNPVKQNVIIRLNGLLYKILVQVIGLFINALSKMLVEIIKQLNTISALLNRM